jgi:hypothetical protein
MRKLRQTLPAMLTPGQLATVEALSPSPASGVAGSQNQMPRPPPELEHGDALWGGQQIHNYIVELLGIDQSLSATYYQIAKKLIPSQKYCGHLVSSRRAIRQRFAAAVGIAA